MRRNPFVGRQGWTIAVIVMLAMVFASVSTHAQERPHAGTVLTVGDLARGISDAYLPYLPAFEVETGIRVDVEQLSFGALFDKMMLEFAARTGYYDIVYLSPGFMATLIDAGYVITLDAYFEEHDLDTDQFLAAAIDINRYGPDDAIWAFPYLADTSVFLYRRDLFEDAEERAAFVERYGYELPIPTVEAPMTTDEFLDVAEFFTRDDMYGFAYPQGGTAYGNLHILPWVWTFGGDYYDADFHATLDDPAVVDAFRFAQRLQEFQPAGSLGWDYGDHIPMLCDGRLAMTAGWFHIGLDANNPEVCPAVAGNIGYAPPPYAPERGLDHGFTVLGGGGLAITADSANPDAAFTFLSWLFADEDRALDWYLAGGAATLSAVYDAPEVVETWPWARDFFPVANHLLATTTKQRPTVPNSNEIFEVMAETWHNVALGRLTPEEAARSAHQRVDTLLDTIR
jgi:multiple sugar transport system substrate-binding protein